MQKPLTQFDMTHLPGPVATQVASWLDQIPLYRERSPSPADGDGSQPRFCDLPFITKADIKRGFPNNFLRPGAQLDALVDRGEVELEQTSGTSEERTPLLLPFGWWGRQEDWALRLNGCVARVLDEASDGARRVTLSSPMCSNDVRYTGVPCRRDRVIGSSLFASLSKLPFLWGEADLDRIARETLEWGPVFLDVDPVYGTVFALYCERRGIRLPHLKFIIGTYEYVSLLHRRIMERAFGVPVVNLYGSTETGHLLMEDDGGLMRPNSRAAWLELVEPDDRGVGDLVVTTLTNDYMPLIRYRIGDLMRADSRVPGGYVVHGRAKDAVRLGDGRRVTVRDLDGCFADVDGVAHYQLVPNSAEGWVLRLRPEGEVSDMNGLASLRQRVCDLLHATVQLEPVEVLMPEKSGKFRLIYPRLGS